MFNQKKPTLLTGSQRVLWLGDSITQDGTFVSFTSYYLNRLFPNKTLDFIAIGLSSETVSGLSEKDHPFPRPCVHKRLQRALQTVRPDVVVACYGMNDGIYHPQNHERMAAFQKGIKRLRTAVVTHHHARLILLTPPPFDSQPLQKIVRPETASDWSDRAPFARYDTVLADYARWEKTLAPLPQVTVVDTHTVLHNYLLLRRKTNPAFRFSPDGIHPSITGHLLMARTLLKSLGVSLPPAPDLEAEQAKITADPLFALVDEQRKRRGDGWRDFVGYTRDKTVRTSDIKPTEAAVAALQAPIDRLRRKSGLSAPQ